MRAPMIVLTLALALIMAAAGVQAATETIAATPVIIHETNAPEIEKTWYELSDGDTVLTVSLPANPSTGYFWDFAISDPEVFELITMEYIQDDAPAGLVGVGGSWVASFKGTFQKAGSTALTLNYIAPDQTTIAETHSFDLHIAQNNQIMIISVE